MPLPQHKSALPARPHVEHWPHVRPLLCRRFEGSQCPARLLEEISLVDTPGVLSGEKQRIERNYNFIDACEWFATRCDLILLLFDPYKLDISDEFKQVSGAAASVLMHSILMRAVH